MSKKLLIGVAALLALGWLGLASQAYAQDDESDDEAQEEEEYADDEDAPEPGEWEAYVDPESEIFPSFLIATAALKIPMDEAEEDEPEEEEEDVEEEMAPVLLGDPDSLMYILIASPADDAKVKVEIKGNALIDPSSFEGRLGEEGEIYEIAPKVNYKFDALKKVRQTEPVNIIFSVQVDGESLGEKTVVCRVRTINDCLYAYRAGTEDEGNEDISWMFAAYVNEDHPGIRTLMKEALDTKIVGAFDGYQSGDPDAVLRQVFTIWNVLQKKGIKYSSITETSSESDTLHSQHVRFLDESVADTQANCVDGSVLIASVLRKMGIAPFLVLAPGHMYLGFYVDAAGEVPVCLETTMLGSTDLSKFDENAQLAKAATDELKNMESWDTFNAAVATATTEFESHATEYDEGEDPNYQVIDIAAARKIGIMPISYAKSE